MKNIIIILYLFIAFNCDKALIAHNLAEDLPSPTDLDVGILPVYLNFPLNMGIWPDTYAKSLVIDTGIYEPAGFGGLGNSIPNDFNFSSIIMIKFK